MPPKLALVLLAALALGGCTSDRPTAPVPQPKLSLGEAVYHSERHEPTDVAYRLWFSDDANQLSAERPDGVTLTFNLDRPEEGARQDQGTAYGDRVGSTSARGWLARHDGDSTIVISDSSGVELRRIATSTPVRNALQFSPKGGFLAAGEGQHSSTMGHSSRIEVWETDTWQPVAVLDPPAEAVGVWGVAFSGDGRYLATSAQHLGVAMLKVWELPSGEVVLEDDDYTAYWIRGVAVSSDGTLVATADESGLVRVRSIESGNVVFEAHNEQVMQAVAISPDNSQIAASAKDSTVRVWDLPL